MAYTTSTPETADPKSLLSIRAAFSGEVVSIVLLIREHKSKCSLSGVILQHFPVDYSTLLLHSHPQADPWTHLNAVVLDVVLIPLHVCCDTACQDL